MMQINLNFNYFNRWDVDSEKKEGACPFAHLWK
jgi:hypothetical protein